MDHRQAELYQRLIDFSFDELGAALTFSARLARENGWSQAFARRVIDEYRRFAFLAVAAGHPVAPSDEVDQAWHLHLTYTRSYWHDFYVTLRAGTDRPELDFTAVETQRPRHLRYIPFRKLVSHSFVGHAFSSPSGFRCRANATLAAMADANAAGKSAFRLVASCRRACS